MLGDCKLIETSLSYTPEKILECTGTRILPLFPITVTAHHSFSITYPFLLLFLFLEILTVLIFRIIRGFPYTRTLINFFRFFNTSMIKGFSIWQCGIKSVICINNCNCVHFYQWLIWSDHKRFTVLLSVDVAVLTQMDSLYKTLMHNRSTTIIGNYHKNNANEQRLIHLHRYMRGCKFMWRAFVTNDISKQQILKKIKIGNRLSR